MQNVRSQSAVQRGVQTAMQQPLQGAYAPANFWEWFHSVYPPDEFLYNTQELGVTIAVGANTTNTGQIVVQTPLWVFSFRSVAVVTSTGVAPTIAYRIGIAHSSSNDWTSGQWMSSIVNGTATVPDLPFPYPREVPASTQLAVTVLNTVNSSSSAITVDASIIGIEPRRRNEIIRRDTLGRVRHQ